MSGVKLCVSTIGYRIRDFMGENQDSKEYRLCKNGILCVLTIHFRTHITGRSLGDHQMNRFNRLQ